MVDQLERPAVLMPLCGSPWQSGWTLYYGGAYSASGVLPLYAALHLQAMYGDEVGLVQETDDGDLVLNSALDADDRAKIAAGYADYLRHFEIWRWVSMPNLLQAVDSREYANCQVLNYLCEVALFGPEEFKAAAMIVGADLECELHSYINRRSARWISWRRRATGCYSQLLNLMMRPISRLTR